VKSSPNASRKRSSSTVEREPVDEHGVALAVGRRLPDQRERPGGDRVVALLLAEGAGHSPVVFGGRVEPAAAALGADHVAHDDDRDPHLFGHVRRPFPLPPGGRRFR